jgi:hypothetical protein
MDQPFVPEGTEEDGEKVAGHTQNCPERVDARQKPIKVSEGDLGEKKKKHGGGDENGNEESFQNKPQNTLKEIP